MKIVYKKHIGVYGVIVKKDKIALIKKARGGYKGLLDLPGGGMEYGETVIETLKRELMEEAGVLVGKEKLWETATNVIEWQMTDNVRERLHHIGILYMIEEFSNELKSEPDNIDSLGCAWYDINNLKDDEITPFVKVAIDKIKENTQ